MRYLVVALASLGAGAIAYVVSMRMGDEESLAIGFDPASPTSGGGSETGLRAPPGYAFLRVEISRGPSIRERLQGFVGSLALVAVAIMAVAGSLWGIGVLISRLIRSFLGQDGGEPPP